MVVFSVIAKILSRSGVCCTTYSRSRIYATLFLVDVAVLAALAEPNRLRIVRIRRIVAAPPDRVWAAWTDAKLVRRWWSPQHLRVARCTVDPVPGGRLVIVLAEGDGTQHRARGRFSDLVPNQRLAFDLSP